MLDILGKRTGSNFYKKFLVKKAKNKRKGYLTILPLDFEKFKDLEEVEIYEDFLEPGSNDIVERSVERRGFKDRYMYILKTQKMTNNNVIRTKRNISAHEYLQYLEQKDKTRK